MPTTIADPSALHLVMAGAIIMACFVAGLRFLRFWRKTDDRLFLMFGLSFWVMGIQRICVLGPGEAPADRTVLYYAVRLIAFLLILIAIVDKNRSSASAHQPPRM